MDPDGIDRQAQGLMDDVPVYGWILDGEPPGGQAEESAAEDSVSASHLEVPEASRRTEGQETQSRLVRQSALGDAEQRARQLFEEHYGKSLPMGVELRSMRRNQEQRGVRESYTLEHLRRLVLWESKRPLFSTSKAPHCSKLGHPNTCKTCTSCHFCRQKTMDIKTFCPCEHIDEVAGSMRGAWCRSCLEGRMGEDFEATMRACKEGRWRCPCCRDICNCSGKTCVRGKRNWDTTGQLAGEARKNGFLSAAHYLILTALAKHGSVRPVDHVPAHAYGTTKRLQAQPSGPVAPAQRRRESVKKRVRREKAAVHAVLMAPSFRAPDLSPFRALMCAFSLFAPMDRHEDNDDTPLDEFADADGAAQQQPAPASRGIVVGRAVVPGRVAPAGLAPPAPAPRQAIGPPGTSAAAARAVRSRTGRAEPGVDALDPMEAAGFRHEGALPAQLPSEGPSWGDAPAAVGPLIGGAGLRPREGTAGAAGVVMPLVPLPAATSTATVTTGAPGGSGVATAGPSDDDLLALDVDSLVGGARPMAESVDGPVAASQGHSVAAVTADATVEGMSPGPFISPDDMRGVNPARQPLRTLGGVPAVRDRAAGWGGVVSVTQQDGGGEGGAGRVVVWDAGAVNMALGALEMAQVAQAGGFGGRQPAPVWNMPPQETRASGREGSGVRDPVRAETGLYFDRAQSSGVGGETRGESGGHVLLVGVTGAGVGASSGGSVARGRAVPVPVALVEPGASEVEQQAVWMAPLVQMREEARATRRAARQVVRKRKGPPLKRPGDPKRRAGTERPRLAPAFSSGQGGRAVTERRERAQAPSTSAQPSTSGRGSERTQSGHSRPKSRGRVLLDDSDSEDEVDMGGDADEVSSPGVGRGQASQVSVPATQEEQDARMEASEGAGVARGALGRGVGADGSAGEGDMGYGPGKPERPATQLEGFEVDGADEDEGDGFDLELELAKGDCAAAVEEANAVVAVVKEMGKTWLEQSADPNASASFEAVCKKQLTDLQNRLAEPSLGLASSVCFDVLNADECTATQASAASTLLHVPEGKRRVPVWLLDRMLEVAGVVFACLPLPVLRSQCKVLLRWFFSGKTFVDFARSHPDPQTRAISALVATLRTLSERGADHSTVAPVAAELFRHLDCARAQWHAALHARSCLVVQATLDGIPDVVFRRDPHPVTLCHLVLPPAEDDESALRRAAAADTVLAMTTNVLLSALAPLAGLCLGTLVRDEAGAVVAYELTPTLAPLLRALCGPELVRLLFEPALGKASVRHAVMSILTQAACHASLILQHQPRHDPSNPPSVTAEDAAAALRACSDLVLPALELFIRQDFPARAEPGMAASTATPDRAAAFAAQHLNPQSDPCAVAAFGAAPAVPGGLGRAALECRAHVHGAIVAASAWLPGCPDAEWASVEAFAFMHPEGARGGWRRLFASPYRAAALAYTFAAASKCASAVRARTATVASLTSCWLMACLDIGVAPELAAATRILSHPSLLGTSLFHAVPAIPVRDVQGRARTAAVRQVLCNAAWLGVASPLRPADCLAGADVALLRAWSSVRCTGVDRADTWTAAACRCLHAALTSPGLWDANSAVISSLWGQWAALAVAAPAWHKHQWLEGLVDGGASVGEGQGDGSGGVAGEWEAARRTLRAGLGTVLREALTSAEVGAASGGGVVDLLARSLSHPAPGGLPPLAAAVVFVIDAALRIAGLPNPRRSESRAPSVGGRGGGAVDGDAGGGPAGGATAGYSGRDPWGDATVAIVAEAVAGAGFKAAALVAGSLCRACMREWRRVPNGMGRAVAAAKLGWALVGHWPPDSDEARGCAAHLLGPTAELLTDLLQGTPPPPHAGPHPATHVARLLETHTPHVPMLCAATLGPQPPPAASPNPAPLRHLSGVTASAFHPCAAATLAALRDACVSVALRFSGAPNPSAAAAATGPARAPDPALLRAVDELQATQEMQALSTQAATQAPGLARGGGDSPAAAGPLTAASAQALAHCLSLSLGLCFPSEASGDVMRRQHLSGLLWRVDHISGDDTPDGSARAGVAGARAGAVAGTVACMEWYPAMSKAILLLGAVANYGGRDLVGGFFQYTHPALNELMTSGHVGLEPEQALRVRKQLSKVAETHNKLVDACGLSREARRELRLQLRVPEPVGEQRPDVGGGGGRGGGVKSRGGRALQRRDGNAAGGSDAGHTRRATEGGAARTPPLGAAGGMVGAGAAEAGASVREVCVGKPAQRRAMVMEMNGRPVHALKMVGCGSGAKKVVGKVLSVEWVEVPGESGEASRALMVGVEAKDPDTQQLCKAEVEFSGGSEEALDEWLQEHKQWVAGRRLGKNVQMAVKGGNVLVTLPGWNDPQCKCSCRLPHK